jgi:hypothetical protein
LEILLGKYFDRYHIELEKSTSGRKPVHIQDSDLVIHTGGTMRNYFGTAYLPSEAPVGFTIDEIQ